MDKVEEMWATLAAYQPQADLAGHGPFWARMCKEKTAVAADAAAAAIVAEVTAATAALCAAAAAAADADAADADAKKWAQIATERMTRVLVKPAHLPVQPTPVQEPVATLFGSLPVYDTTPPAAQPAPAPVQVLQRYSPDGEGGMEVDSLGAYVKHQDVSNPPAQPAPVPSTFPDFSPIFGGITEKGQP
jgi:hypothetical protein